MSELHQSCYLLPVIIHFVFGHCPKQECFVFTEQLLLFSRIFKQWPFVQLSIIVGKCSTVGRHFSLHKLQTRKKNQLGRHFDNSSLVKLTTRE